MSLSIELFLERRWLSRDDDTLFSVYTAKSMAGRNRRMIFQRRCGLDTGKGAPRSAISETRAAIRAVGRNFVLVAQSYGDRAFRTQNVVNNVFFGRVRVANPSAFFHGHSRPHGPIDDILVFYDRSSYGRLRAHFDGKVIIPDEPADLRATRH